VRITLVSGRILFDDSLPCWVTISSYFGIVVSSCRGTNHLIAARLELADQLRQCLRGRVLEVVHQDDALAALFQLSHHRVHDLIGLPYLEVERVDVSRENRDVALAEIGHKRWRMLQVGEAEGETGAPAAALGTALLPISISCFA
jgi:hypothetical protein